MVSQGLGGVVQFGSVATQRGQYPTGSVKHLEAIPSTSVTLMTTEKVLQLQYVTESHKHTSSLQKSGNSPTTTQKLSRDFKLST